jgi:glucose/arabinose dehydrogenase
MSAIVFRRSSRAMLQLGGVLAAVVLVGSACSADTSQPQVEPQGPSASSANEVTSTVAPAVASVVAKDLVAPWSVVPLVGAQEALISERDSGRILLLDVSSGESKQLGVVAGLESAGEGGLMGLALAKDQGILFAMYSASGGNKVVSYEWTGGQLGAPSDVITSIPRAQFHDGGRIAVGPDEKLYVATGDAGTPDAAQDPASLAGKILRLELNSAVPSDNPFPDSPVYSLGHRNVQGLTFDDNKNLWASEFGESDFDELNLIQAGGNYGWPIHEGPSADGDFISPKAWWSPTSTASPSGIAYASGNIWVAALRGETLWQVPISGTEAGKPISRFVGQHGRLRDIAVAGPEQLWMLTNNTDTRGVPSPDDDQILNVELTGG